MAKQIPARRVPPPSAELDLFKDLIQLNPGKVYNSLKKRDPQRKIYGLIPKMAAGLKGCIGFLPAASFCEQVNSVAKEVMTDAHLLMGNGSLEMMVVL